MKKLGIVYLIGVVGFLLAQLLLFGKYGFNIPEINIPFNQLTWSDIGILGLVILHFSVIPLYIFVYAINKDDK